MLSKPDIERCLAKGDLKFEPGIADGAIAQVSIDLRLGNKFTRFKDPPPQHIGTIRVSGSLWDASDIWEETEQDLYRLEPGKLVLAQTLEAVTIPPYLVGLVEGRSSWARVGITIHVTAPKIDPGFSAPITLEMANFGTMPVELRAGIDRPAQLMLIRLSTPLSEEDLYGSGKGDIFQHQSGPIPHGSSGE